ncbi:MAG: crotonobetainyl-CoA--carnitine CoA-transferase [Bacteroidia bacterium]|nr:crotonobetainyl-CoA--carnitine CoA-transferase [Bacteroidia bacterium]
MAKKNQKNTGTAPLAVTKQQEENRGKLLNLFKNNPLPDEELSRNMGLFLNPADLRKFLFINDLYKLNLGIHGVIMELGVRWGQNLALFQSLRSIYEPYNYNRQIIGFDTWRGFPAIHKKDGEASFARKGAYSVSARYEEFLFQLLRTQEQESPLGHLQKFELVKGDAGIELKKYLDRHPETIISLAYFDFDIYEPTKKCLELIQPYLTKGSIIAFDELNQPKFPGETIALRETLGLTRYSIRRSPYSHFQSYLVVD